MNLPEFKAWFSGFIENLDGRPTERQWARIQEKVEAIKDAPPVTHQTFIHDYYPPWRRWYAPAIYTSLCSGSPVPNVAYSVGMNSLQALASSAQMGSQQETFDASVAFAELGRAEFRSIR